MLILLDSPFISLQHRVSQASRTGDTVENDLGHPETIDQRRDSSPQHQSTSFPKLHWIQLETCSAMDEQLTRVAASVGGSVRTVEQVHNRAHLPPFPARLQ